MSSADTTTLPSQIIKRNGAYVRFDLDRIEMAVTKCYGSLTEPTHTSVEQIVGAVANIISARYDDDNLPNVEAVQDLVESILMAAGEYEAAKHYILYREEHSKQRVVIPAEVEAAFAEDQRYFGNPVQQFMFYDKYSRFNWELMRRETWHETVDRVVDYLTKLSGGQLGHSVYDRIRQSILDMRVMPSMRLLAMAGPAAERNSMAIYNCSYLPVLDIKAFEEAALISLAGCGVGYSVERQYVEQFPRIQRQKPDVKSTWVVNDSAEGWGEAVRVGIEAWFAGEDIDFDFSQIRPAGLPLKTKGGRASGPEPLQQCLAFLRTKVLARQGSFLRTIDAHDMMCMVGGMAVSGGVRRTAMIALFDFDDHEMRTCKDGAKLDANQQRWNANNSAVWPEDVTQLDIVQQFTQMYENKRGEPGIFSRTNANANKPYRRPEADFGSNPCGEINLRPYQFCNLSIAVARREDTVEDLIDKVQVATIIGTIQSLATTFPGMRPQWKYNCEEERLLGVDVSGQQDCPAVQDAKVLASLKHVAIVTNRKIASQLGINPSAAITCNKPNGNSSQFLDCSNGIHRRWSEYYIRNMRVSPHTPVYRVLRDAGVPMDPENGQNEQNATSWVVHFPVKAPEGTQTRRGYSAVAQCEYWLLNKINWTEHNPSVTITYEPDELIDLIKWVWEHKQYVAGMAFLPADDAQYAQMPYEEIDAETYNKLADNFPTIDWSRLYAYEKTDMTTAAQELACMSGACEVQL